jgi:hypothetical protein
MESDATIADVIVWSNGMVIVLDQVGEEIPTYQGQLAEVRDAILEAAGVAAHFYAGVAVAPGPAPGLVFPITREQFAASDLLDQFD